MKGYDIRAKLPDLILPGDEAGRTRVDYYDVIAQLYKENYHGKLRDWCEAHGTAYTAHLLARRRSPATPATPATSCGRWDATTRPGRRPPRQGDREPECQVRRLRRGMLRQRGPAGGGVRRLRLGPLV